MAKAKSDGKKAKAAEKKLKAVKKGEKKEKSKKSKIDDSDDDDMDLDAVLADLEKKQKELLEVKIVATGPPPPRASGTLIANPAISGELLLFGGEVFNGRVATFFNDLYVYKIQKDEWLRVISGNAPLPRSGHAWTRGGNTKDIWLFGGEFSSPKQGTFYHYNDFWRLDPSTREWERIECRAKNKAPPARSGHRMCAWKQYILLFGGFQDNSNSTKYLQDLWIYDAQSNTWYEPKLPPMSQKPDSRSSFSFLPNETGAVLYGGYSRVKAVVSERKIKGSGHSRNVLVPLVHTDCWYLRITFVSADAAPTIRWERRKKPVNVPNPARAGCTMAFHHGRGIAFGGVHDVEESEEGIESEFYNTLHAWNIERNRYQQLSLRRARNIKRLAAAERGGRRARQANNEEELLRNLAALETGKGLMHADEMELDLDDDEEPMALVEKPVAMEFPHPRFNAQLAVQGDILYIYGGTWEKGDREYTFDDLHAIDLGKLDGVKQIFSREPEGWQDRDQGGSSESEDSDEEDSEGNSGEDESEDEAATISKSVRKHKNTPQDLSTEPTTISKAENDVLNEALDNTEEATENDAHAVDDTLPYPRPFESRRDFFTRTSNEWQELLMQSLRWKGIQPESLSVKEIRTRAFDMSADRFWDVREEIQILEDEQSAAGIGEVVTLADRTDGSSGGHKRR